MIRSQRKSHLVIWLGLPVLLLVILFLASDPADDPVSEAPYAGESEVLP